MALAPETILFGSESIRIVSSDLAKAVGVDPSTITRWKREPKLIPLGKLQRLCRARHLTDDQILQIVKAR